MEKLKFTHRISKGTRFNQIYIPNEMREDFEAGDLVEVTLLKKNAVFYYSKNLVKLSGFKKNLIKNIFSELKKFKEIKQVFIVGSFLTQKQDFNDIDVIIVSEKDLENKVYEALLEMFELKFHIINIPEENFKSLQKFCPMTRSMFHYFVSNKKFNLSNETEINKNHIRFLLMMPEDILKIQVNSRVFYDSLRRLITIERFLENLSLDHLDINKEIKKLLGENLAMNLRQDEKIDDKIVKRLRNVIESRLNKIYNLLGIYKDEQK